MPYIPPSDIKDIPSKQREKLKGLLKERTVLGYAFSYRQLHRLLSLLGSEDPDSDINTCIVAMGSDETDRVRKSLNEQITGIFEENGIKTLRDVDPFGNRMDYVYMETTTTSFNRSRFAELAIAKLKVPADKLQAVMEEATTKTPIVTLQCRKVKEEASEKAGG